MYGMHTKTPTLKIFVLLCGPWQYVNLFLALAQSHMTTIDKADKRRLSVRPCVLSP